MYYTELAEIDVTIRISAGLEYELDYDNIDYARMIKGRALNLSSVPRLLRREIEDALIAKAENSSFDWKVEVEVQEKDRGW